MLFNKNKSKTKKKGSARTVSRTAVIKRGQSTSSHTRVNKLRPKAENAKKTFPDKFPFWARLKIGKNRTTLVIDEDKAYNKQKKQYEDGYVHREATHTYNKDYLQIRPNPDKEDNGDMYLKRPQKKPKRLFKPHEKDLDMPDYLREMYDKNNKKE